MTCTIYILAPYKWKSSSKFQKEMLKMINQCLFQISFIYMCVRLNLQKFHNIRIFHYFLIFWFWLCCLNFICNRYLIPALTLACLFLKISFAIQIISHYQTYFHFDLLSQVTSLSYISCRLASVTSIRLIFSCIAE